MCYHTYCAECLSVDVTIGAGLDALDDSEIQLTAANDELQ
jgi:hypothetical protein